MYDELNISEFICGFLEMMKASEDKWKSASVDGLHLIMEKVILYQRSAVPTLSGPERSSGKV